MSGTPLDDALAEARATLAHAADGHLPRPARLRIQDALGGAARAALAVLAARRVLPIWQDARPDDPRPAQLLDRSVGDLTTASVSLEFAVDDLTEAGQTPEPALMAARAALKAYNSAEGDDEDEDEDEDDPDVRDADDWDLDPYFWPADMYASVALAGGDREAHRSERRAFWTWWLDEAVPEAARRDVALDPVVLALLRDAGAHPDARGLAQLRNEVGAYAEHEVRVPDRARLATLLIAYGLTPADAATVVADARWGIVLEPGGTGATRLGGRPVLPAGMPWPTADGRPLTHLATLALAELPDVEGRDALPADGHVALLADLSDQGVLYEPLGPGWELGAPLDDRVRIVFTPPGAPTHEPSAPAELPTVRVAPTARLQMRWTDADWAERLYGLDQASSQTLEALCAAVNGRVPHQLLGWPLTVQDDPRGADAADEVLLHIAADAALGLSILDAGALMFFGRPEDLRAARWERVTVWPSSC